MLPSVSGLPLPRRLDHSLRHMVEDGLRRFRSNSRHFSIDLPLPSLRPIVLAEILASLQMKTVILSRNLSAQREWLDKYESRPTPLQETAEMLWSRHTGHLLSTLPLANAPVLVLNNSNLRFTDAGGEESEAAERLERHLQKHLYRLIVLDDIAVLHPSWKRVTEFLAQRPETCILEFTPTGSLPHFSDRVDAHYPLAACIRDGMVLPMHHMVAATLPLPDEQQAMRRSYLELEEALHKLRSGAGGDGFGEWMERTISHGRLGAVAWSDAANFLERLPRLAEAMVRVARSWGVALPQGIPIREALRRDPSVFDRRLVLAAWREQGLRDSPRMDPERAARIQAVVNGVSAQEPMRVSWPGALSRARRGRVQWIVEEEHRRLGEYLRAVVVIPPKESEDESRRSEGEDVFALFATSASVDHLRPAWLTGVSVCVPAGLVLSVMTDFQKTIQAMGLDIVLRQRTDGIGTHIYSESADWNSRTYEMVVSSAFGRGILRTVCGTADLLSAGWGRNAVSTLVRLSGPSAPLLFNARDSRGEIHHDFPWKTMTVWDILAISDDTEYRHDALEWLDERCRDWFAPADDGCLDSGRGRIHPLLLRPHLPSAEEIIAAVHSAAVAALEMRDTLHRAWGREAVDVVEAPPALTLLADTQTEATLCCGTPQLHHLREEISRYLHRRRTLRTRLTFWGALAAGIMFIELLYLPTIPGLALAALTGLGTVVTSVVTARRTRSGVATRHELSLASFLVLLGEVVLSTVQDAEDVPQAKRIGTVDLVERGDSGWRLMVRRAPEPLVRLWASTLRDLLDAEFPPEAVLQTYVLNVAGRPLKELAMEQGVDLAYRHAHQFPLPSWIAGDERALASFLSAWEARIGRAAVLRTMDPRDRERPPWNGRATLSVQIHESTILDC